MRCRPSAVLVAGMLLLTGSGTVARAQPQQVVIRGTVEAQPAPADPTSVPVYLLIDPEGGEPRTLLLIITEPDGTKSAMPIATVRPRPGPSPWPHPGPKPPPQPVPPAPTPTPPVPTPTPPTPTPPPTPPPAPVVTGVIYATIIWDAATNTPASAAVRTDPGLAPLLKALDVRFEAIEAGEPRLANWKPLEDARKAGLPALLIQDKAGKVLSATPLPATAAAVVNAVKAFRGN